MSNITLANIIFAAAGAVVGGAAVYILMKNKFKKHSEEEIESVKEKYYKAFGEVKKDEKKGAPVPEEEGTLSKADMDALDNSPLAEYHRKMEEKETEQAKRVLEIVSKYNNSRQPPEIIESRPYKISEEEAGDRYDELYCYKWYRDDSTLTDENDDPLLPEEIAENVGFENLDLDEDDIIYIRNEVKQCDYEISAIDGAYGEEFLIE